MADTLLGFVAAMNGIPDNTSKLVSPQNTREAWLSLTQDRGIALLDSTGGPVTVPLAVNTWTDLPGAIIGAGGSMIEGKLPLFWRMDINGQLGYDYAADWPTTAVPPGYDRQVIVTAVLEVALASNSNTYEFSVTQGGLEQSPIIAIEEAQNQDINSLTLVTGLAVEVAAAERISVSVRNPDGANGFDVLSFGYLAQGGPPA